MRRKLLICIGFAWLALPGCGSSADPPAAPAQSGSTCERPGQQCRLRAGVLGVCERRAPGQAGFDCSPQH